QLTNIINGWISSGTLKVGDLLPSEVYFCETLHLSRSTVRKAFSELEGEGKIVRKRGKGTFITKPKLHRRLDDLYNFSKEMQGLGLNPSSEVLCFEVLRPNPIVAKQLKIGEDEHVYRIKRLRKADGKPILLETAYIPVAMCEHLCWEDLTDSLYSVISENTGALPAEATEVYEAICLKEKDAGLLNCKPGSPAFQISRTSRDTNGRLFEYCKIIAPGYCNMYEITLRRNQTIFSKHMQE
ncbi:MAG: GntR family transcriptional regulator, partial [Candidatus Limivicinus sp.]